MRVGSIQLALFRNIAMTKKEFTELLAKKNGLSTGYAEKITNAFLDSVEDALFRDGRVALPGLGVFDVREIAARKGRNPASGEPISIPASRTARFRSAAALKDALTNTY